MKKAFLFSGYGSQFIGMAKDVYDESRIMQEYFEEASNCLNTNFVKLCFASSETDIDQMTAAYPAVFLVSCAFNAILKERGVIADAVIGYNTGDYAALYAAQTITFPDGLYLLSKYAQQYQLFLDTTQVAMCAIKGMQKEELQALCTKITKKNKRVDISIYVTDDYYIVGGHAAAIDTLKALLSKRKGVTSINQPIALGLHSVVMDPVIDQFKMYLEKVDFKDPVVACMNSQADILAHGEQIKKNVTESLGVPIYFNRILDALIDYDLIVQVGPGDKLSNLVKEKYPDKIVLTIQSKQDLDDLALHISNNESDMENTDNGS